jgi:prepilin-type N-terminal cleavage/methylation domain-containing protein
MSRLRAQNGFTIVEMLMAMTIGLIVLSATFALLDSTARLNTGVIARTDAMQRGRSGMDTITQQLRSQVCLDYAHSAVIAGSDASSVTFYGDFTDVDDPPVKRRILYDPVKHQIRSETYRTTWTSTSATKLVNSYPVSPTGIQNVLENATLQIDPTDPTKTKTVPFLQYFAYPDPTTVAPGAELQPNQVLTPPLTTAQAARVARIDINYMSRPTNAKDNSKGVNLSDQIMARHADPNLSVPDPNCI